MRAHSGWTSPAKPIFVKPLPQFLYETPLLSYVLVRIVLCFSVYMNNCCCFLVVVTDEAQAPVEGTKTARVRWDFFAFVFPFLLGPVRSDLLCFNCRWRLSRWLKGMELS